MRLAPTTMIVVKERCRCGGNFEVNAQYLGDAKEYIDKFQARHKVCTQVLLGGAGGAGAGQMIVMTEKEYLDDSD